MTRACGGLPAKDEGAEHAANRRPGQRRHGGQPNGIGHKTGESDQRSADEDQCGVTEFTVWQGAAFHRLAER